MSGGGAPSLTPDLPRELQIEVTAACNLRCRMCLVRYQPPVNRIEGSLSFETFKRIVDDLPDLQVITLQGLGEPLLAPDLFRLIEYAAARGIRVGFNTNATLLTRAKAERLVRGGLAWLHISLDGATAETYQAIRDGAAFEPVRDNVRGLVDAKRRLDSPRPELALVFVAMRQNIHELSDLVRLTAEWGVGKLRVQNLSHSFSDTDPAGHYREIREFTGASALWNDAEGAARVEQIFEEARRTAADAGVDLRLPHLEPAPAPEPGAPGCDWPWRAAFVTRTGTVQPCCMLMGADRGVLGDATREGFATVWRGAAYREFRAALLTSTPPDVCRGCSMYRGVF